MMVALPENIPALQGMNERDLKQEIAVSLYQRRKVTLMQAATIADLNLFEFQGLLRDCQIPQHYDEHDLESDMMTLRELRGQ